MTHSPFPSHPTVTDHVFSSVFWFSSVSCRRWSPATQTPPGSWSPAMHHRWLPVFACGGSTVKYSTRQQNSRHFKPHSTKAADLNEWKALIYTMKGTEVPNPRSSSACDCTCVLTGIDHCFVTLSCLPCALPTYAKFTHKFLTLFHRPCATYL